MLSSVQKTESPKGYLMSCGAVYIVCGNVCIFFVGNLFETLVFPSIVVNAEVTAFQSTIFHFVTCRHKLVAEESLSDCPNLGCGVRQSVQQVAIVKQYFIWFLKVTNAVHVRKKTLYQRCLLKIFQVFECSGTLDANIFRQLGYIHLGRGPFAKGPSTML